jgi:hypothetical protein
VIKFPCKCGHLFNLTEDQAGGLAQCPRCGLLVDVPTLNDLANLNPDGTFAFSNLNLPNEDSNTADLHRAFSNTTLDSQGREKDLRTGEMRAESVGDYDQLTQTSVAPRYDPVTGELIRPIQFKDEVPLPVLSIGVEADESEIDAVPVIPLPVVPKPKVKSLGYATGDAARQVTLKTLALELWMPANAVVIFFVFVLYLAGYYTTGAIRYFTSDYFDLIWPFLLINLPMWLIISHAGCVIEDTGPDAIDEVPRPLRNFAFGEDIVAPLLRVLLAAAICFTIPLELYRKLDPNNPMTLPILFIFTLIGSWCFPAVVLTTVTGTTVLNLRPDRLFSVIKLCGLGYPLSVILFILATAPSIYYLTGKAFFHVPANTFFQHIDSITLAFPIMLMTAHLLHCFCWHLGLMYRENHPRFPWLAQRHIKVERPVTLRAMPARQSTATQSAPTKPSRAGV